MNQAIDQNMTIRLDLTDTYCPDLTFKQTAKQKGECNMGSIAESLAEASMAMSKEQMIGLPVGMNVDSSLMERTSVIKQYLEQECGTDQAIRNNMKIELRGTNLTCKQLQAIQDADQTTQCIINAVTKAVTKDELEGSSKQTADLLGPLAGALTALFTGPVLILGGILLAIGIFFLLLRLGRGTMARADAAGTSNLPSDITQLNREIAATTTANTIKNVGTTATQVSGALKDAAPAVRDVVNALRGSKKP
jgi:hypothetical protein